MNIYIFLLLLLGNLKAKKIELDEDIQREHVIGLDYIQGHPRYVTFGIKAKSMQGRQLPDVSREEYNSLKYSCGPVLESIPEVTPQCKEGQEGDGVVCGEGYKHHYLKEALKEHKAAWLKVVFNKYTTEMCVGALISQHHMLVPARCLTKKTILSQKPYEEYPPYQLGEMNTLVDPSDIIVKTTELFDKLNRDRDDFETKVQKGKKVNMEYIVNHYVVRAYEKEERFLLSSLAILHLPQPMIMYDKRDLIAPVCLPHHFASAYHVADVAKTGVYKRVPDVRMMPHIYRKMGVSISSYKLMRDKGEDAYYYSYTDTGAHVTFKRDYCTANGTTCEGFLLTYGTEAYKQPYIPGMSLSMWAYDHKNVAANQEYLIGMHYNSTHAISVEESMPFICIHTLLCPDRYSATLRDRVMAESYFFDGRHTPIDKVDIKCSEKDKTFFLQQRFGLEHLSPEENKRHQSFCGIPFLSTTGDRINFVVTIIIRADPKIQPETISDRDHWYCSGALITIRHVITTKQCVMPHWELSTHSERNPHSYRVIFIDHPVDDKNDKFPFSEPCVACEATQIIDRMHLRHYNPQLVGNRWLPITKVAFSECWGDFAKCEEPNIAILETGRDIGWRSAIKPVCISHDGNIQETLKTAKLKPKIAVQAQKRIPYTGLRKPEEEKWWWNRSLEIVDVNIDSPACPGNKRGCLFGTFGGELYNANELHAGIPLYHVYDDMGRVAVIGISHGIPDKKETKNKFTHMAYLGTFICLNIGLCKEGEDLTGEKFNPFSDMHRMLTGIDRYGKHTIFKDSHSADRIETERLQRQLEQSSAKFLTDAENWDVQHECGKNVPSNRFIDGEDYSILDLPWAGQLIVEKTYYPCEHCSSQHFTVAECVATIVSPWHALAPSHCARFDPAGHRFFVNYGKKEVPREQKVWDEDGNEMIFLERMEVKSLHNIFVLEYDIVILTFKHSLNSVNNPIHQFPCIAKPDEEFADNKITVYGNKGKGWCKNRQWRDPRCNSTYFTYEIMKDSEFHGEKGDPYWSLTTYEPATPSFGDSGAPLIRKNKEGRAVMDGMVVRELQYPPSLIVLKTEAFHNLVCSFIGLCRQGYLYYDPNKVPLAFVGGNGICPQEHPNRTKQFDQ